MTMAFRILLIALAMLTPSLPAETHANHNLLTVKMPSGKEKLLNRDWFNEGATAKVGDKVTLNTKFANQNDLEDLEWHEGVTYEVVSMEPRLFDRIFRVKLPSGRQVWANQAWFIEGSRASVGDVLEFNTSMGNETDHEGFEYKKGQTYPLLEVRQPTLPANRKDFLWVKLPDSETVVKVARINFKDGYEAKIGDSVELLTNDYFIRRQLKYTPETRYTVVEEPKP